MEDDILYRGVFRLRKHNREDETAYRYLQNLPSGVKKNDIIKKALLEYIRRQTYPENNGTGTEELSEQLKGMEERILKAIDGIGTAETKPSPQKEPEEKPVQGEIPGNALSFLAGLNNGQG